MRRVIMAFLTVISLTPHRASTQEPRQAGRFRDGVRGVLGAALEVSIEGKILADGTREARPTSYPVVTAVRPGSPAARGGLQVGDTLVAIDGHDLLEHPRPLDFPLGSQVGLRLRRKGVIIDALVRMARDSHVPDTARPVLRRPE